MENKEVWRNCKYYEENYQVSSYGRVWSVRNQRCLKPQKHNKGYLNIVLTAKNGKAKQEYIHRLVALTFIDNPDNKPTVNHKDENKQNNHVDNLEWATYAENNAHNDRLIRQGETFKVNGKTSKKVNQFDLDGNFIKQFNSIREAERSFGVSGTNIFRVCKGQYKQSLGYIWKYAE